MTSKFKYSFSGEEEENRSFQKMKMLADILQDTWFTLYS